MSVKPKKIKMLIELVIESRKLFGTAVSSRNLRRQWIKQTQELIDRGIHLALTGKYPKSSKELKRRETDKPVETFKRRSSDKI